MNKKRKVLLVPAGSGMAIAAIQAIKEDNSVSVIAADSDELAAGLFLAEKGYVVPPFNNVSFFLTLREIVKRENIDVVLPALDTILLDFAERKNEFEKVGTRVLVSEPESIKITRDKWETYKKLEGIVPLPLSCLRKEDVAIDYPLIIKPRGGSGSKDVHVITSKEELDFYSDRVPCPILQEYLPGTEYTVDCLADMDGNLQLSIPRTRIETTSGISTKGRVINDTRLDEMAERIALSVKLSGPFFFQAKEDQSCVPKLTEINARISGAMSLSSKAGPNIHSMSIKLCLGEPISIPKINYGLWGTRYWGEIFLTHDDKTQCLRRVN
jgi:carbamoyl-phosphate synthase large subunit